MIDALPVTVQSGFAVVSPTGVSILDIATGCSPNTRTGGFASGQCAILAVNVERIELAATCDNGLIIVV